MKEPTSHVTWKKGKVFPLSEFFKSTEFECHCNECSEQTIAIELVSLLTEIRKTLGFPIKITSGYRCTAYQKKLKDQGFETAVGTSQHELGNAADIFPIPLSKMLELSVEVEKRFKAIGIGRTFFHVDLRKDKIRRWNYGQ